MALSNHPVVKGAQAGLTAAKYGADAAVLGYYPDVSISTVGGRVYQDNSTSRGLVSERGAAYSGYGEANVALRQTLFDGFGTQNEIDAMQAKETSRVFNLLDVEDQVTFRVAQSYIDILRIRGAMEILDRQASSIKDYEKRIANMVAEGVADEAEMQQARDVAMIIDSSRADYEGQLLSARAAYAEVVGQLPSQEMALPRSLYEFISDDIAQTIEKVKAEHPYLRAASMDSQAARHEVEAMQSNMYPEVTGELSYTKSDKRDVIGGEAKDARAVVRVNWGFSTGGQEFASIRQKQYEQYELAARRDDVARQIEKDIYQAYASYRTYQKKLKLAEDRVILNEKLLSAYKTQFEGSRISLLNLMRAESQMYNAQLALSDNTYNCLSSEYAVLSALGTLRQILLGERNAVIEASDIGESQD